MKTKELFESIGFDGEYRIDTENFYYKYFKSETIMHQFIIAVLKNDDEENTHRRMINQVRRFVELANDIGQIRQGCDPLRIMFLRCGLESLINLSKFGNKNEFYKVFSDCFSDDGKKYILDNFRFNELLVQKEGKFVNLENSDDVCSQYNLTMADFWEITKNVRDSVVHDGIYWDMQFFSAHSEYDLLTSKISPKKMIPNYYIPKNGENVFYSFETNLQYEKFIEYFVEGCINYILKYVREKAADQHNE